MRCDQAWNLLNWQNPSSEGETTGRFADRIMLDVCIFPISRPVRPQAEGGKRMHRRSRLTVFAVAVLLVVWPGFLFFPQIASASSYYVDYQGPIDWEGNVTGPGWEGPGLNPAALFYRLVNTTPDLGPAMTLAAIRAGLGFWGNLVEGVATPGPALIAFTQSFADGLATLDQLFGTDGVNHPVVKPGCPPGCDPVFPSGPGGVLAHCFFPGTFGPNPETIAGDCHYDEGDTWRRGPFVAGFNFDLDLIAAHEIGHGLGLLHSPFPVDVMRPFFGTADTLPAGGAVGHDREAICSLYACVQVVPEAGTLLLLVTGLFGSAVAMGTGRLRRRFLTLA